MSKPLVSVIVPIYNVEKYLEKCVTSIRNQDYTNLEIILVDDGSPDACPQLCDAYAKADKRIRVIHKKNGGLSDARNAGIRVATGDYLAFIDSDDYVDPAFVSTLLHEAQRQDADIVACSLQRVYDDKTVFPPKWVDEATFSNIEGIRDILSSPSLCDVMAWNKLYKKELFTKTGILYPVGKVHEDMFTTYKLFYAAQKICFVNKPLYYYVQREGSIINQGFNKKRLHAVEATGEVLDWVTANHLPLEQEAMAYRFGFIIVVLNDMVEQDAIDKAAWDELAAWVAANKKSLLRNPFVSRNNRLLIRVLCLGRRPYITSRKLFALLKKGPR